MSCLITKIIKGFKKINDERSLESMNSTLYTFFNLYCDFIAHYNIQVLRTTTRGRNFLEFLRQITHPPFYLMNNSQYGEWVQEMIDYSKRQEKKIRFEIEIEALATDTFQIVRVW